MRPGCRAFESRTSSATSSGVRQPTSTVATAGCRSGNCTAAAGNGTRGARRSREPLDAGDNSGRRGLVVEGVAAGEDAAVEHAAAITRCPAPRKAAGDRRPRCGRERCIGRRRGSSRGRPPARSGRAPPSGSHRRRSRGRRPRRAAAAGRGRTPASASSKWRSGSCTKATSTRSRPSRAGSPRASAARRRARSRSSRRGRRPCHTDSPRPEQPSDLGRDRELVSRSPAAALRRAAARRGPTP